jgi:hypothetical protein
MAASGAHVHSGMGKHSEGNHMSPSRSRHMIILFIINRQYLN